MIELGIIGCGHWGPNFVRNFNQAKGACVKYVCDLSQEKLTHIKKLYPKIEITKNHEEVLDNKNITAVVIATPANTHYKLVKKFLLAGKHILVEKPITIKISEANELIKIANDKKRILMVGHTFMYNTAIRKIKSYIQKGEFGRIYYLYSRRTNLGPLRKDVSAMWDLAPHDISIFSYFLNANPIELLAKGEDYLQKGKQDVAFITATYSKKIIANMHVSWLDPHKVREITIVGSKKMLVFNDLDTKEPIKIYDKMVMKKKYKQSYDTFEEFQMIIKEGKTKAPRIKLNEPLKVECEHFLNSIKQNKQPLTDGLNGLNVLKVLNAVESSLKSGTKVKVRR